MQPDALKLEESVLRAEIEVARLTGTLRAVQAEAQAAEAMFNASLGRPAGSPVPPLEPSTLVAGPADWSEIRSQTFRARPELAAGRAEISRAEAEISVMKSMYRPMGVVRTGPAYTMADKGGWMLGVGISLPIWRGPAECRRTGKELEQLSPDELRRRASDVAVYARVTADHKLRIIRAWQTNDAVVAMTGDGVNDAPAIKGADIGVAMGRSGTEVTKQASDMIVTDDNFASIVAAVEEGRGIYDNIRKTLQYLLAGNTGELLLMTGCVLVALPVPLLPIHLLWINLVTDGLPALCLAADPIDPGVMQRPPRKRSERITDRGFLGVMVLTGFLTAGISLAVYLYGLRSETPELARTHAFAVLVFAELLRAFGCRSETKPVWRISLGSNLALAGVVAVSFGLQVWSHHREALGRFLKTAAMPLTDCIMLLVISVIPPAVLELLKVVRSWTATSSQSPR